MTATETTRIVTADHLGELGACEDAVVAFAEAFPDGIPLNAEGLRMVHEEGSDLLDPYWVVNAVIPPHDREARREIMALGVAALRDRAVTLLRQQPGQEILIARLLTLDTTTTPDGDEATSEEIRRLQEELPEVDRSTGWRHEVHGVLESMLGMWAAGGMLSPNEVHQELRDFLGYEECGRFDLAVLRVVLRHRPDLGQGSPATQERETTMSETRTPRTTQGSVARIEADDLAGRGLDSVASHFRQQFPGGETLDHQMLVRLGQHDAHANVWPAIDRVLVADGMARRFLRDEAVRLVLGSAEQLARQQGGEAAVARVRALRVPVEGQEEAFLRQARELAAPVASVLARLGERSPLRSLELLCSPAMSLRTPSVIDNVVGGVIGVREPLLGVALLLAGNNLSNSRF